MRISLFALAIGAISQVRAQAHINLTAAAELPPCVMQCAVAVYPSLNCTPADPCYCAKTGPVADALLACVTRACDGFKESLQGLRFQAESCGWERDRNVGPQTRDLANSLFGLASFFLFGRIASRWPRWGGAGYWWDDLVVCLVYIPVLAMLICGNLSTTYGFGRDLWTIPTRDVVRWAKIFFWMQPLYVLTAFFTKLSLVLLYLRIFPADVDNRQFRLICKLVGVVLFLAGFSCVLANIFACHPISYAWRYTGRADGACVDRIASAYAVGSINAVLDIVVITLPIPRLFKLNVALRQKVGVILCFLVGFLVTGVTIVRLYYVHSLIQYQNATWTWNTFVVWCAVEVYCSMICACMPPMIGLVKRTSAYIAGKLQGPVRKRLPSLDQAQDEKSSKDGLTRVEIVGKVSSP